MRPGALEQRIKDQAESLENAARFVRPGGRLVYVTCSLLKAENEDRVAAFLESHADFLPIEAGHLARGAWACAFGGARLEARRRLAPEPLQHGDRRVLRRRAGQDLTAPPALSLLCHREV